MRSFDPGSYEALLKVRVVQALLAERAGLRSFIVRAER